MAQPSFITILSLVIFLSPCLIQAVENSLSVHDDSPPSAATSTSENSNGFPAGCQLYQNRRLLLCRNAQLQAIPELSDSWNVEIVDLSGNNISTIRFGNGYKNVKSVHLERNNITTITEDLIFQLQHFHLLSLGGNPFHCDCKLEWLRERLLGIDDNFPRLTHIENLICASPVSLQGKTLVNLSKDVLCGREAGDTLLRTTTPTPTLHGKKAAETMTQGELAKENVKAMEKGRIAEIIGVTLAFAAIIVIMSVVFIVM